MLSNNETGNDVRLSQHQAAYLAEYIQDQLPGVLVCNFLNTTKKLGPHDPHMGGTIAVVSEAWKGSIRRTSTDCTGLGLLELSSTPADPTETKGSP